MLKKFLQYIAIAYGIAWFFWGILLLIDSAHENAFWGHPFAALLFILGAAGPPAAAYFLMKKDGLFSGPKDFLKFSFDVRHPPWAYLVMLAFLVLHFGLPFLFGGTEKGVSLPSALLSLPLMIFMGGTEEIGWHGYLLPLLEEKFHFIEAVLACALLWTLWHTPLFFIEGTAQSGHLFWDFFIECIVLSFTLTAVRHATGSMFLCILFHALVNALLDSIIIEPGAGTYIAFAIEAVAAITVCVIHDHLDIKKDLI